MILELEDLVRKVRRLFMRNSESLWSPHSLTLRGGLSKQSKAPGLHGAEAWPQEYRSPGPQPSTGVRLVPPQTKPQVEGVNTITVYFLLNLG